jgi:colanic acid biosynthesis glycosyl transferase WcaI
VYAICAQPTYASRGAVAPKAEIRDGVHIERRGSTRFDKDRLPLRILNALSISTSLAVGVWSRARKGDQVLVVTTPPLLPFTVWLAATLRGATRVLLVHDVYPEVLVATNWIAKDGLAARFLTAATTWLFSRFDRLIVIGRDMADIMGRRSPAIAGRISIVPNWASPDIAPSPPPAAVSVLYSGNIGRTHAVEKLLDAAALLRDDARIRFVISGWGGKRNAVEAGIAERSLKNVTLQDPVPNAQLSSHLGAATICVIALVPGM